MPKKTQKKNKVTKNAGKFSETLDKRFYAPYTVHSHCPHCGSRETTNLEDHYLSYPVIGEPCKVYFYCDAKTADDGGECGWDWSVLVKVGVTITLA